MDVVTHNVSIEIGARVRRRLSRHAAEVIRAPKNWADNREYYFEFFSFAFDHRAAAALRALSLRWALVIFLARAVPPALPAFSAISLRRSGESAADRAFAIATACGFLASVFTRQGKPNIGTQVLSME